MKVFRDLFIQIRPNETSTFIHLLEEKLHSGWEHDAEGEQRAKETSGIEYYYFICEPNDERKAALLALTRKNEDIIYVANIVPREIGELTFDQYNFIIEEFYNLFVIPSANELSIQIELTSAEQSIEEMISEDPIKKLTRFSRAANKSTGSSHPLDRERWYDFLLSVHPEHEKLHVTDLRRWLIEDEHWPEDTAHDLAIEYEFSMGLLDYQTGIR